jgi:hypothetical protein
VNTYQQLILDTLNKSAPDLAPAVSQSFKTEGDVAQNIGFDKLSKKPYNPYGVALPQSIKSTVESRPNNFRREMLRDVTE